MIRPFRIDGQYTVVGAVQLHVEADGDRVVRVVLVEGRVDDEVGQRLRSEGCGRGERVWTPHRRIADSSDALTGRQCGRRDPSGLARDPLPHAMLVLMVNV